MRIRRDRCEPMAMGPSYYLSDAGDPLVILVLDPGIRTRKCLSEANLPKLKQGQLPLCQRAIDLIAEKELATREGNSHQVMLNNLWAQLRLVGCHFHPRNTLEFCESRPSRPLRF